MKVFGVNMITSNTRRLRFVEFDTETAQTGRDLGYIRGLRTRTSFLRSYANLTKVEGEAELDYEVLKELMLLVCNKELTISGGAGTQTVYVPADSHDLSGSELKFAYKVFDNDNIYLTPDGYIEKLELTFNALSIPKAQFSSFHPGIVSITDTFEEVEPGMFLNPKHFTVTYKVYDENGALPTEAIALPTYETVISIKQNLKPLVGKNGTVTLIYSEKFELEVELTSALNDELRTAFLNNRNVVIQIDGSSGDKTFTILFPRLVMYNFEETKEFGLVNMKFKPNALQKVPIQFSYA